MIKILTVLSVVSFCFSAQDPSIDSQKPEKKNFIDNYHSDDSSIQTSIDSYKKDFKNERDQINQKYKIKKERLKKQRLQEMDQLHSSFKNKMNRLKEKHPKKIKLLKKVKSSSKEIHPNKNNNTKPLTKNKYVNPRKEKNKFPDKTKSSKIEERPIENKNRYVNPRKEKNKFPDKTKSSKIEERPVENKNKVSRKGK